MKHGTLRSNSDASVILDSEDHHVNSKNAQLDLIPLMDLAVKLVVIALDEAFAVTLMAPAHVSVAFMAPDVKYRRLYFKSLILEFSLTNKYVSNVW